MAVADGAILRVVGQILFPDDVIMQNVFNLVFADTGASNDEADVISDAKDWLESMYDNLVTVFISGLTCDELFVYVYDSIDDDWDEVGSDTWSVTFTAAGDMFPHGNAAVLIGRTTDPDVSGKKFLGGMQETFVSGSIIQASMLTALGNFATDWITPFVGAATGGDFAPVIWSPTNTNAYLLTGAVVNAITGYQRRRKPGVGI